MTCRISVDFNTMTMDPQERVLIPTHVELALADHLRSGLRVILHDETLEVDAVVNWDDHDRRWWGKPDWTTARDFPYLLGTADHAEPKPEPDTQRRRAG